MNRRFALAAVLALVGCDQSRPHEPMEPDIFGAARAAMLVALKDPESARFGPMSAGKPGYVCGTVNARNSFGGYTGMRAFVWSADGVRVYEDPPDWGDKGIEAEIFGERGCTIGADHASALKARRLLDESNRRILGE